MNIVICTHQRLEITSINIESLLGKANIILVVSDKSEAEYYSQYPIRILIHPNTPLGAKWQCGVNEAKNTGDAVMILGSDDILDATCVDKYESLLSHGHDFIGLSRWWQHYDGKAYLCDYLSQQPLGGGRCYSSRLLQRHSYGIFHPRLNSRLDDQGWKVARSGLILNEPLIHAIKGNWAVINRFNPHHKNVRIIEKHSSMDILPDVFYKLKYGRSVVNKMKSSSDDLA